MIYAAPIKDVKAGTRLQADDGFTCIRKGKIETVQALPNGDLFIKCSHGQHSLDGQEKGKAPHKYYTGLRIVP